MTVSQWSQEWSVSERARATWALLDPISKRTAERAGQGFNPEDNASALLVA